MVYPSQYERVITGGRDANNQDTGERTETWATKGATPPKEGERGITRKEERELQDEIRKRTGRSFLNMTYDEYMRELNGAIERKHAK